MDLCEAASERLGEPVCVTRVADRATWDGVWTGRNKHWARYLVPARTDARLPALIADSGTFTLHYPMVAKGFPTLFPGLNETAWGQLSFNPRVREFYAGNVLEHLDGTGFAFSVEEVPSAPIGPEDVRAAWVALAEVFTLGPLRFEPSDAQRERMASWTAFEVPTIGVRATPPYEAYSEGTAYGRLRRVHADAVPADLLTSDVVVFDAAPFDLATPIAAAVSGTPQGALSHLNVRSAARGTPSCYEADAWTRLAAWDGELVRVSCGDTLEVSAATAPDVAAYEAGRRPVPVVIAPFDRTSDALMRLEALPVDTVTDRAASLSRYGAKGRNLAILTQHIPADWTYTGFLIPFAPYSAFMDDHAWSATLAAWFADPTFLGDRALRATRLAGMRDAIEATSVDPAVLAHVSAQIEAVFGATTMVRFRSSSNAEDGDAFGGAGLYESTSVCLADDRDDDAIGPSRCDPLTKGERGVQRGLLRVWSSLWTDRAVEERLWYGIPSDAAAMAILVDPRAVGEQANIVAFTGDPNGRPGDPRAFLIEAQLGEAEVVSADPGVWPEQVRLVMNGDAVARIDRLTPSSLASQVLSDDQLRTLGSRLSAIEGLFPLDVPPPAGRDHVLDTEWKVLADGRLVIKQVRPFLR